MDRAIAQSVFRRTATVSVARVKLAPDVDVKALNQRLAADPRLSGTLIPEQEFFAGQSASRAALIDAFAYLIAGIMALGSVFGALATMFTAVSRRAVEIAAILGGGGFAGCWWEEARLPLVRTAAVRQTLPVDGQRQVPTVLNASGYVTPRLRSTVSSKVTGRIVDVLVEEGMAVTEGQVLARLDDTTERSYLALAEARLVAARGALAEVEVCHKKAHLDLDRQLQLLHQLVIRQEDLDAAQAEADSLEARLANQREQVVVAERETMIAAASKLMFWRARSFWMAGAWSAVQDCSPGSPTAGRVA